MVYRRGRLRANRGVSSASGMSEQLTVGQDSRGNTAAACSTTAMERVRPFTGCGYSVHAIDTSTQERWFRYLQTEDGQRNDPIRRVYADKHQGYAGIATRSLQKGDIVCQYKGTLCPPGEYEERSVRYEARGLPCAFYQIDGARYFDAYVVNGVELQSTEQNSGIWINHSRKNSNCKVVLCKHKSSCDGLLVVCTRTVAAGEMFLQDYGDRQAMLDFDFLKQ